MGREERHRRTFWAVMWSMTIPERLRVASGWIFNRAARRRFRGLLWKWLCGSRVRPTPAMTVTPRKPKDELRLLASKIQSQRELDYALSMVDEPDRARVRAAIEPYLGFKAESHAKG